jgi:hypothetical protein
MNQQKAIPEFEAPTETRELSLPQRAAVALASSETETKLRELVKSSADIVAVVDVAGREQAHRIGMNLKGARVTIEKTGKAAREDAQAFSKAVIAEEKRLVGLIAPEEDRVIGLRDGFDAKLAAEEAERQRIEEARIYAIRVKIDAILTTPARMASASAAELTAELVRMAEQVLTKEEYAELLPNAIAAMDATAPVLIDLRNQAAAREKAEADRLAAIEAEKQRVAAAAEANRIEAERLAALQREHDLAEAERQRQAQSAEEKRAESKRRMDAQVAAIEVQRQQVEAAAQAESERVAAERAAFEQEKADFARERAEATAAREAAEASPAPSGIPDDVAHAAVETAPPAPATPAETPVEGELFEFAPELAGESTISAIDKRAADALKMAVWDLLQTNTPDEVRAMVEADLTAFGKMGDA